MKILLYAQYLNSGLYIPLSEYLNFGYFDGENRGKVVFLLLINKKKISVFVIK